jgi:hypothetical protein
LAQTRSFSPATVAVVRQRKEEHVRKILLCLVVAAALAVPAAAAAKDAPGDMICGTACDGGGGGWTGCTTVTGEESGGVWGIAGWHHYLVVSYCKVRGLITQLSIVTTAAIRAASRSATSDRRGSFRAAPAPGGRTCRVMRTTGRPSTR